MALKFSRRIVSYSEVPEEVSVTYAITGCKGTCPGCHSEGLRDSNGNDLSQALYEDLAMYRNLVSVVCILGGSDDPNGLSEAIDIAKGFGLKVALYTREDGSVFESKLDYIKTGEYISELGGLASSKTNQRMYELKDGKRNDITSKFWRQ